LKKIVLTLFFIANALYGFEYDAKLYMGVGGGVEYEKFNDKKGTKNTPAFGSVKFGYGDRRAYAIEFILNYIDNRSNIFSTDDKKRYGMDIMFVKAYNLTKYFYPLFRAGIGAGEMKVKRRFENKVAYSSYNVGIGAFFPINTHYDIEATYQYCYTSYESIDLIATKERLKSHINQIYFGINYRF